MTRGGGVGVGRGWSAEDVEGHFFLCMYIFPVKTVGWHIPIVTAGS